MSPRMLIIGLPDPKRLTAHSSIGHHAQHHGSTSQYIVAKSRGALVQPITTSQFGEQR